MPRTIFTGFSPNLTARDARIFISYLCFPWKWKAWRTGPWLELARKRLREIFGADGEVFLYDSGRSALYSALRSLGVGEGDEVLLQAFTCVVVSNAIKQTGAKPVYVDILEDFTMDLNDLQKKITPHCRAIIVQHTFGQPANLSSLVVFARAHGLRVVEDCAHSLGARINDRQTGTIGDIGMFSFGSDKVVSCVRGGALFTRNPELVKKLRDFESSIPHMRFRTLFQHLMHAPVFYIGKALYGIGVGRWMLGLAKLIRITNKIIDSTEKRGESTSFFPSRLSDSLAHLLFFQLSLLESTNESRRRLASLYRLEIINPKIKHPPAHQDNIYLRYTIRIREPKKLIALGKLQNILLGDWYSTVIAPSDSDQASAGYIAGSCPMAEKLASESVNLPTDNNIGLNEQKRIIQLINSYGN